MLARERGAVPFVSAAGGSALLVTRAVIDALNNQPIIVEGAMYRGWRRQVFRAGHASAGITGQRPAHADTAVSTSFPAMVFR